MITVAHEIDCADRVEIGDYSSAGRASAARSSPTASNLVRDRFVTGPVEIGAPRGVMSGSHPAQRDARYPPRSIVSAGSVVNTR